MDYCIFFNYDGLLEWGYIVGGRAFGNYKVYTGLVPWCVWIEDCVALSKYIEDHLNRDEEDYELEVGSAGLGQLHSYQPPS